MEVHIGKGCLDVLKCGLCEDKFETLTDLELHLTTCEIYECGSCYDRYRTLSEIKKHIEDDHEDRVYLQHLKMDRKETNIVSFKSYWLSNV